MGARRRWGVLLAVPGTDGIRVEFRQNEFPTRTYASEAAAVDAAVRLTVDDADGCRFIAARVSAPPEAGWPIGEVVEYRNGIGRRFNVVGDGRWETGS